MSGAPQPRNDSKWVLLADIVSVKLLLWWSIGGRFRDIEFQELTEDDHLYFWDRYSRLATIDRAKRPQKAAWYERRAQDHYDATKGGPPYAAAMARPRPKPYLRIDAIGRKQDRPKGGGHSAHAPY